MRRSRSFLIAFVAAIVELLIVIGSGNQWVTNRVADNATGIALGNVLAHGAVGIPWRFNPQTDRERIWAAQLIGIGALIVLLFLFVLVLTARSSRGRSSATSSASGARRPWRLCWPQDCVNGLRSRRCIRRDMMRRDTGDG